MHFQGKQTPKKKGCNFVGGVVSPLLANIYLDELDKYMESNYLSFTEKQREWRRKKGKANFLYVCYADDFLVLSNGTKEQAQEMKEELKTFLKTLGLPLSEEKTKVTHITEGFKFLGYWIIKEIGETGKAVPKVLVPESAVKRARYEIRRLTSPQSTKDSTTAKIVAINRFVSGWCQYYRCTSSPSGVFGKLEYELFWGMAHWLGRKYKLNMPSVFEKYKKGQTFVYKSARMVKPDEYKAKKRLVKTWHNPYTGKEKIERESFFSYDGLWTGTETWQGKMDLREEMILLKDTVCAIQGSGCISQGKALNPSEVEMDHIKPRATFKDPTEADSMDNLQPVCTPCHRAKTKRDLKVLSRMR